MQNKGINVKFGDLLCEIQERDDRDRNRPVAPLRPADDALLLDSTMTIDEVVGKAYNISNLSWQYKLPSKDVGRMDDDQRS